SAAHMPSSSGSTTAKETGAALRPLGQALKRVTETPAISAVSIWVPPAKMFLVRACFVRLGTLRAICHSTDSTCVTAFLQKGRGYKAYRNITIRRRPSEDSA